MPVIRVNKTKDYTVMSNYHLRDKRLTLKAKGLLSVILSLPDNWEYSIDGLISICKENETAVRSALNELKDTGYLVVNKLLPNQTASKKFEYVYEIYEHPLKKQECENQGTENQGVGFLYVENQGVGFLDVENQGQLNTDISNTNKLNTNESNTERENRVENRFTEFWENYPRKSHMFLAEREYAASVYNGAKEEWLIDAAKEYALCVSGTNSRYIKLPENWLKENLYLDYPPGTYEKRLKELKELKDKQSENTKKNEEPYDAKKSRYAHLYSNI